MNETNMTFSSPTSPSERSRTWLWTAATLFILVLIGVGAYFYFYHQEVETSPNAVNAPASKATDTAAAIENDLNQADLTNIDAELKDIDQEIKKK